MTIPQDLIQRLVRAHNNAVKAAQKWTASTPGTRASETLWDRFQNAEDRFEAAVAAVVDAGQP